MVSGQSFFSRSLWNEAKLGAYYTDVGHCKRLGRLFGFPSETCILEPSCGDFSALTAFIDMSEKKTDKLYTFGVELNEEVFQLSKSKMSYGICSDFLNGTRISNKAFSFCFTNPPYGDMGANENKRLEDMFVERIFNLMKPNGYLVLIVSFPQLQREGFSKRLFARFSCESLYRFDDNEYKKFKQVAFIGKRRSYVGAVQAEYDAFIRILSGEIPYIPMDSEEVMVFEVPESLEQEVELFTTRVFNPDTVINSLGESSLFSDLHRKIFQNEYVSLDINQPVLPLKKDLLYICAISGGGQGISGSEENKDVHLQRGIAKRVEDTRVDTNDDGQNPVEVVAEYTQIGLNIIDNYGRVIELI